MDASPELPALVTLWEGPDKGERSELLEPAAGAQRPKVDAETLRLKIRPRSPIGIFFVQRLPSTLSARSKRVSRSRYVSSALLATLQTTTTTSSSKTA